MKEERSPTTNSTPNLFELWKEYEGIAMHFNELIIQLRIRALGGVAIITAFGGYLSKTDSSAHFSWGVVSALLIFLALVWVAIWIIDVKYYNRLLLGAVRATLEIEKFDLKNSPIKEIKMSHRIKETVEGDLAPVSRLPT